MAVSESVLVMSVTEAVTSVTGAVVTVTEAVTSVTGAVVLVSRTVVSVKWAKETRDLSVSTREACEEDTLNWEAKMSASLLMISGMDKGEGETMGETTGPELELNET
uniref:Uncharacterized protein n=1 Tax=Cacopsylla melanoneura TaxID=428564 RepID=A0A8D8YM54_9HEMI